MKTYHKHPHHAICNLEGGDEEVLHLHALKKDLGIEIRVDEQKTGVVIKTRDGMYRVAIPGMQKDTEKKYPVGDGEEWGSGQ